MAHCVYCKSSIGDGRAVDVCDSCGVKVWGAKMFRAIVDGMKESQERGDLEQGSVV
jgi:uncharacterized UBP type Zn finger protein